MVSLSMTFVSDVNDSPLPHLATILFSWCSYHVLTMEKKVETEHSIRIYNQNPIVEQEEQLLISNITNNNFQLNFSSPTVAVTGRSSQLDLPLTLRQSRTPAIYQSHLEYGGSGPIHQPVDDYQLLQGFSSVHREGNILMLMSGERSIMLPLHNLSRQNYYDFIFLLCTRTSTAPWWPITAARALLMLNGE